MTVTTTNIVEPTRQERRVGFALSEKQVWALLFTAPYIVVFLAFVVFPVGYAFWMAR